TATAPTETSPLSLHDALPIYATAHPWVRDHELKPKSVVREMVERAMTFGELVAAYGLARSEGVLLRYLTDAYRALGRLVPPHLRDRKSTRLNSSHVKISYAVF